MRESGNYFGRFSDGSPDRWRLVDGKDAWRVRFPNGVEHRIDKGNPEMPWAGGHEVDDASTKLWLNSLRYTIDILEAGGHREVLLILESFGEYIRARHSAEQTIMSGSLDHQTALQLRTLCEIYSGLADGRWRDGTLSGEDLKHLQHDVIPQLILELMKLIDENGLLKPNNHGIMLGISLLHVAFVFPSLVPEQRRRDTIGFLERSFVDIFGEDGVANENTPLYQGFYLFLLKQASDFLSWGFSIESDIIKNCLERATVAYRAMLLPDGSVPPIGDSGVSRQSEYVATPGCWHSEANGLFVNSTSDSYLSFVCGYRGVFHKHLDDTSVFLWHNGRVLIGDAGFKSYDKNDIVALSVRGQAGHSGLFDRRADTLDAQAVCSYGENSRLVKASLIVENDKQGRTKATGKMSMQGFRANRTLTIVSDNHFLIRDEAELDGEALPVSRFVFAPQAKVSFYGNRLRVVNGNSWAQLKFSDDAPRFEVNRGWKSEDDAMALGFYSPRPYSAEKTFTVDVPFRCIQGPSVKRVIDVRFGSSSS